MPFSANTLLPLSKLADLVVKLYGSILSYQFGASLVYRRLFLMFLFLQQALLLIRLDEKVEVRLHKLNYIET